MTWDEYFMGIAETVSKKSRCYSSKRGVILVQERNIISTGYNGPPSGMSHCENRVIEWLEDGRLNAERKMLGISIIQPHEKITINNCPRILMGYKSSEGLEWCAGSHAEKNAIDHAAKLGIRTKGSIMYCFDAAPCRECCKSIVNSGISEIVVLKDKEYHLSGIKSSSILSECGIKVRLYEKI